MFVPFSCAIGVRRRNMVLSAFYDTIVQKAETDKRRK
jgi:hypothetical protein